MTSERSLRILVTPLSSLGHINACHGLCEELRDRGHEVIFVLDKAFTGQLARYDFKEYILESSPKSELDKKYSDFDENKDFWQQFVVKNADRYAQPPLVQLGDVVLECLEIMFQQQNRLAEQYKKVIEKLKPDLLVHDGYICFPTIVNSSVPWLWLYSAAPNGMLMDPRIPPSYSGLPIKDKEKWNIFIQEALKTIAPFQSKINDLNLACGGKDLQGRLHPYSNFLNVFMQPQELRYKEIGELPENVVAVDCFVRTIPDQTFEVPEELIDKPGKLILFSMGSFACANLKLMTRLVAILAKLPHRFIVSKGPLQYDLPGDNFLPQTAIYPLVDLVITHGGNNTVTEGFYYGKPMLVMPLFGDQLDNAQRIAELGFGARLNPYQCLENEMRDAIEGLLTNHKLAQHMSEIGKRIRASNDKKVIADLIESKLIS